MNKYQPIIGLEVHIELNTKSKVFCGCSAEYFGHDPNTHVCPVCLGLPGALPVPNKEAIERCLMLGMALNCQTPKFSKFDRKNYFYPDLPKGYQISQYDLPLCINGWVEIGEKKIKIRRVHQEEDTGKLIHAEVGGGRVTLIDFNRSGVPLVEIVTEPVIHSAGEAKTFLQKLQQLVRYLDISDCDMEKGSMRLEPNISLRKCHSERSEEPQGERSRDSSPTAQNDNTLLPNYKVEVKNINSFKFLERAIEYEIKRQEELLENGETPKQETRGFDERKMKTLPQRGKEEAHDYRYFPEPDIPPMRWDDGDLEKIKAKIPELPDAKLTRFIKDFQLSEYDANILTTTLPLANYFEEAVRVGQGHNLSPKQLANVIINKKIETEKILPAELIEMLLKKAQVPKMGEEELIKIIQRVLDENQKAVEDYKKGKEASLMFLVGQVMRLAKGAADAETVKNILKEKL